MVKQTLRAVPWAGVKLLLLVARRMGGTVPWPESVTEAVYEQSPEEIERVLAGAPQARWEDGSLTSWRYEGEVLNLRTPWGTDDDGHQLQLHARFRVREDGLTGGIAHVERAWYEPGHIRDAGMEWKTRRLHTELGSRGIVGSFDA